MSCPFGLAASTSSEGDVSAAALAYLEARSRGGVEPFPTSTCNETEVTIAVEKVQTIYAAFAEVVQERPVEINSQRGQRHSIKQSIALFFEKAKSYRRHRRRRKYEVLSDSNLERISRGTSPTPPKFGTKSREKAVRFSSSVDALVLVNDSATSSDESDDDRRRSFNGATSNRTTPSSVYSSDDETEDDDKFYQSSMDDIQRIFEAAGEGTKEAVKLESTSKSHSSDRYLSAFSSQVSFLKQMSAELRPSTCSPPSTRKRTENSEVIEPTSGNSCGQQDSTSIHPCIPAWPAPGPVQLTKASSCSSGNEWGITENHNSGSILTTKVKHPTKHDQKSSLTADRSPSVQLGLQNNEKQLSPHASHNGESYAPLNNHSLPFADDDSASATAADAAPPSSTDTSSAREVSLDRPSKNFRLLGKYAPSGNVVTSASADNIDAATKIAGHATPTLLFLQYKGETKRAIVTEQLGSLDDVLAVFLRHFPTTLSSEYLCSPFVKVYIQDASKADLFYELDDLRDLKDKAVLKLHEQQPAPPILSVPAQSHTYDNPSAVSPKASPAPPQPTSYHPVSQADMDDLNYFSEPEFDSDYNRRRYRQPVGSASSAAYRSPSAYTNGKSTNRYGTLDSYYKPIGGGYDSAVPPPKPSRLAPGFLSHSSSASGIASRASAASGLVSPPPVGPYRSASVVGPMAASDSDEGVYHLDRGYYQPTSTALRNGSRSASFTTQSQNYAYRTAASGKAHQNGTNGNLDIYSSLDRTGSLPRSGSITPVIDEEARYKVRMDHMEKQLSNLSSLVHTALVSQGGMSKRAITESVYRDIQALRRDILGANDFDAGSDSGSVSRFSDLSSEKGSYHQSDREYSFSSTEGGPVGPVSVPAGGGYAATQPMVSLTSDQTRQQLRRLKRQASELQSEVKNLRRTAQSHAQSYADVMRDAFDRIKVVLQSNKNLHQFVEQAQQLNAAGAETNQASSERSVINQEQDRYRSTMGKLEGELCELEQRIEELRKSVVGGARKLRVTEVESFTEALTHIGRTTAGLKTQFPHLQNRLKNVMSAEMEKVVREEKFLKEEPDRIDSALRRCKKLTNTMVTMKKLAMVQDPNLTYGAIGPGDVATAPRLLQPINANLPLDSTRPSIVQKQAYASAYFSAPPKSPLQQPPQSLGLQPPHNTPVVGHSPSGTPNGVSSSASSSVLDSLLEELQTVGRGGAPPAKPEKRVGFADQSSKQNGDHSLTLSAPTSPVNGTDEYVARWHGPAGSRSQHAAMIIRSPTGTVIENGDGGAPASMISRFGQSIRQVFSNGGPVGPPRARSTTPSFGNYDGGQAFYQSPPAPPPRTSSSSRVTFPGAPPPGHFKSQYYTEIAAVHTNAIVDEEPRVLKSASSSESVNSQDGAPAIPPPPAMVTVMANTKPPPPPPPPRNKQEMMEQRQRELVEKHGAMNGTK